MTSTGWAEAQSIDDVLDRMETISSALPAEDGVATFNRMYHQVTRLVDVAIDQGRFGAGPFLGRLDVHFANLFFEAYAADLDGREVNDAWAPLFENRRKPRTHPIQFALHPRRASRGLAGRADAVGPRRQPAAGRHVPRQPRPRGRPGQPRHPHLSPSTRTPPPDPPAGLAGSGP